MAKNNPKYILIHCSDIGENVLYDQFNNINTYHRDERSFPRSSLGNYVGYHALITGGRLYTCKTDQDEGAHCNQVVDGLSMNFQSLGVCVGFDGDIEYMSAKHYEILQEVVWRWQDAYNIPNERVQFHRDYASWKTCPGTLITKEWLKMLLTRPPTNPPQKIELCLEENAIIKKQTEEIKTLKDLLNSIISWFKNIKI